MDQCSRLEPPAIGHTPSDPLRDFIIERGRTTPLADGLPLVAFGFGVCGLWFLFELLWWLFWSIGGMPAVASARASPDEVALACLLGATALFAGRPSRAPGWRATVGALCALASILALRLIDFEQSRFRPSPARPVVLFVESAHDWSLHGGSVSPEPGMRVRDGTGGRHDVVIGPALLAHLVPGRTCIRATMRYLRGYAYFEPKSVETGPPGRPRDESRARCLAAPRPTAAPALPLISG